MASYVGLFGTLRLELAYFAGWFWLQRKARGAGVILRFERVRPGQRGGFQPNKPREITPEFLDRTIGCVKRWNYDIVSTDEMCRRAVGPPSTRRFVCLTFDGAYKDIVRHAYPVLARHGVPFTIYPPTAFLDGVGEAWWLALEAVIRREDRLSLVIDGRERRFNVERASEKYEVYEFLEKWMASLPPADLSLAIKDLCKRCSVDLAGLSREASMDWNDLAKLAADPLVTIGTATVNYPMLSRLRDADALREMTMGRAVAQTALQRNLQHFAFPFGDPMSFGWLHARMAEQSGFKSAVSAIPGVVEAEGRSNLYALPRLAWDGRHSLRALRVFLLGRAWPDVSGGT